MRATVLLRSGIWAAKIVTRIGRKILPAGGPASRGIIGTPEYIGPKQMQPGSSSTRAADIYALATSRITCSAGRPAIYRRHHPTHRAKTDASAALYDHSAL